MLAETDAETLSCMRIQDAKQFNANEASETLCVTLSTNLPLVQVECDVKLNEELM